VRSRFSHVHDPPLRPHPQPDREESRGPPRSRRIRCSIPARTCADAWWRQEPSS